MTLLPLPIVSTDGIEYCNMPSLFLVPVVIFLVLGSSCSIICANIFILCRLKLSGRF